MYTFILYIYIKGMPLEMPMNFAVKRKGRAM